MELISVAVAVVRRRRSPPAGPLLLRYSFSADALLYVTVIAPAKLFSLSLSLSLSLSFFFGVRSSSSLSGFVSFLRDRLFTFTLKNLSIFWHSAGTYVQIWRFQKKKKSQISKSQNLMTLGQFFPQKNPFCSTSFLFCPLDAKIHLENKIKQGGYVTLWPCSFTLKSISRQKKNYGNSNIFTMQKI